MLTKIAYEKVVNGTFAYFEKANIVLTEEEKKHVEVVDFGLNEIERTGVEIITYVNTERVCAKEMVLFPHQTCAEHRHPAVNSVPGKEETFRCRYGLVFLYVSGVPTSHVSAKPPKGDESRYTVFHEIKLLPGEQYTMQPDTLHWFTAGDEGAVISEFSTHSDDSSDIFTDSRIKREPEVMA